LFFEFARIADVVRPGWVLIENVPGLLSSNGGRDFGELLGTLADVGYGVAWRILDSQHFGVPQRRRRVFILARLADGDTRTASERAGQILAVGPRCHRDHQTRRETRTDVAGTLGNGTGGGGRTTDLDGHGAYVASLSGLGSGGPDDNDGQAGRLVMYAGASVRRLTPTECERLQGFPDAWTVVPGVRCPDSRRYAAMGDAVTVPVAEWIGRRLMEMAASR
jgi:DNA (cytosine-5)-methyltransferase 1